MEKLIQTQFDPYCKLNRSIELLDRDDFNSLIVISKAGLGKSYNIDKKIPELESNVVVVKGDISEAKLFEFLYKHREGYIIVFRDMGKFLRNRVFIETLKHICEPNEVRHIIREVYKDHDVPAEFDFESRIILELNEIGKRYKEDIDAVISRGLFVEIVLSQDEIKKIMEEICKSEEDFMVTEYLINKSKEFGNNLLNLRVQNMCFKLFKAAQRDKLDWKKEVDLFLETQKSDAVKLLYRFAGDCAVRRIEFIKYLIESQDWSLSTAKRRISQWLELGEIFSNGMLKQDMISISKK